MMLHHIPDRLCPGLRCRIISQKDSTRGYDAASYPRQTLPRVTMPHNIPEGFFSCVMMLHHIPEEFCPWLGCCIISRRILPWVVMLHHITDRLCPGLQCRIISQKDSALGYDAASHPRQTLPWVMMPHNIPEGFYPGL